LSHKEQARKKLLREHNEFTRSYKEQARKELLREHNEFTRSYKELLCSGKNDVFKDWYMCSKIVVCNGLWVVLDYL
jgi:hypothetical protein